jgi:hypothetical protein
VITDFCREKPPKPAIEVTTDSESPRRSERDGDLAGPGYSIRL